MGREFSRGRFSGLDGSDEYAEAVVFHKSTDKPAGPESLRGAQHQSAMPLTDRPEQEVAGAEDNLRIDGSEAGEHGPRFRFAERLGAGTFEVAGVDLAQGPEGLAGQQSVAHPKHVANDGWRMINHDARDAAGSKNAPDFANGLGGIGGMMKDTVRVDDVERVVREGKVFSVGDPKV